MRGWGLPGELDSRSVGGQGADTGLPAFLMQTPRGENQAAEGSWLSWKFAAYVYVVSLVDLFFFFFKSKKGNSNLEVSPALLFPFFKNSPKQP